MTQVTRKATMHVAWAMVWIAFAAGQSYCQTPSAPQVVSDAAKPAEALYLKLRSVGLDPARTYRIRGASLDRPALHVSFEDGRIAFTSDVAGRITGAFFEGDGELLLTPPNQVERASLSLFTGMAILEERFATAYLRFNDDTFAELQPYFREDEDAAEFAARWNETARNLAEQDAFRLLGSFSRNLPVSGQVGAARPTAMPAEDRMLHVRALGLQLGTFDVYFDTRTAESVWAGQSKTVAGQTFYDLWTSFVPAVRNLRGDTSRSLAPSDVLIPRFKIRARVNPPTTLMAEAVLQVEVQRGGERTLYFELSRFLQVSAVEVNGKPVEFINNPALDGTQLARRGNDLVAVVFPEVLQDGQKLELKFTYKGDVLSEAGGGLLYVGARGTWYPNRGLSMAEFDLEFRYPAGWTLVATGKRTDPGRDEVAPPNASAAADPDEQFGHWTTERPSQLAGFNLGRYDRASARAGDVLVEAYAARSMEKNFPRAPVTMINPPLPVTPSHQEAEPLLHIPPLPSPARNVQAVAEQGARAVEFFAQRFGPYPYNSLELTQMPGRISQGWPGLVFLSSFAFLTPAQTQDLTSYSLDAVLNSLILPHETAHQWWGDLVGWRTYRDQWLVEALANYCALLMTEADKPNDARQVLDKYRSDLLVKNKDGEALSDAGPVTLGLRLTSSHFPGGYEAVSYGRGTWLFHMLRHMLLDAESRPSGERRGTDEPFLRALRKIRERYQGKAISTREFFAVFEEDLPKSLWYEGRKSLDWFVESWVEGVDIPRLSTQKVKFVRKPSGSEVNGIILQEDAPKDLVSAVPVYAASMEKRVLLGIVMADGPETKFHFSVPPDTKKILLDPYQTMLTAPK